MVGSGLDLTPGSRSRVNAMILDSDVHPGNWSNGNAVLWDDLN